MENSLAKSLAKQDKMPANAMEMIASVVSRANITSEGVAALAELIKLQNGMEDRAASKDFDAAMAALQSDIPIITASSVIPNRGKYERFEDIMRVIKPLLSKYGFSVGFSMAVPGDAAFHEGRVTQICHVSRGGHTRPTPFGVRIGGRSDSETQADCKAATTAKRLALCGAFNIIIQQDCEQGDSADDDARLEGKTISLERAGDLHDRLKALFGVAWQMPSKTYPELTNEQGWLHYAKAETWASITEANADRVEKEIINKEAAKEKADKERQKVNPK